MRDLRLSEIKAMCKEKTAKECYLGTCEAHDFCFYMRKSSKAPAEWELDTTKLYIPDDDEEEDK